MLHEIPSDVTVQAFVTPEGRRLRFLVRAPLESMRDIEFPQYGLGYLDLEAAGPFLRDAAQLWLADYVTFHEEDRRLGTPRIVATRVSLPSDRSFATYETALAHFDDPPLDPGLQLPWRQALLDVLLEYEIESDQSAFLDRPGVRAPRAAHGHGCCACARRTGRSALSSTSATRDSCGSTPAGTRRRCVSCRSASRTSSTGSTTFSSCSASSSRLRTLWGLLPVITSFTIAHSITLIASAFGIAPRVRCGFRR